MGYVVGFQTGFFLLQSTYTIDLTQKYKSSVRYQQNNERAMESKTGGEQQEKRKSD